MKKLITMVEVVATIIMVATFVGCQVTASANMNKVSNAYESQSYHNFGSFEEACKSVAE